jgi:hypothetical protein
MLQEDLVRDTLELCSIEQLFHALSRIVCNLLAYLKTKFGGTNSYISGAMT